MYSVWGLEPVGIFLVWSRFRSHCRFVLTAIGSLVVPSMVVQNLNGRLIRRRGLRHVVAVPGLIVQLGDRAGRPGAERVQRGEVDLAAHARHADVLRLRVGGAPHLEQVAVVSGEERAGHAVRRDQRRSRRGGDVARQTGGGRSAGAARAVDPALPAVPPVPARAACPARAAGAARARVPPAPPVPLAPALPPAPPVPLAPALPPAPPVAPPVAHRAARPRYAACPARAARAVRAARACRAARPRRTARPRGTARLARATRFAGTARSVRGSAAAATSGEERREAERRGETDPAMAAMVEHARHFSSSRVVG